MLCQAWEPPHPLTINGEFLGYKLTYESRRPRGGTGGGAGARSPPPSLVIPDPGVTEFILRDLATYTQYTLALQVLNPEGEGPATKVAVMTDEGGALTLHYRSVNKILWWFSQYSRNVKNGL